jgi:proline dehydrogenase
VDVASHDVPLASACLRRLAAAGTSHDLELLHGLPTRKSLRAAGELGVRVRLYVGYGRAHMPYVIGKVAENPSMIVWLARDLLRL